MTNATSNGEPAPERKGDDSAIGVWAATVEAIIFASPKPVRAVELQNQLPEGIVLESLLPLIEARFDDSSGIEFCQVGDAFAFRTRADIAERLSRTKQVERPLSRAALERTPGRPLTWGTSPAFLDHFGLADLSDLPGIDDLKSAGLLRKGQVIDGLVDSVDDDDHDAFDETGGEGDPDLLEEAFLEADGDFGDDGEEDMHQDA